MLGLQLGQRKKIENGDNIKGMNRNHVKIEVCKQHKITGEGVLSFIARISGSDCE